MRHFKVINSAFINKEVEGNHHYRLTINQSLDDINRNVAMAVGANLYEYWFNSTGIKRWILGVIINKFK